MGGDGGVLERLNGIPEGGCNSKCVVEYIFSFDMFRMHEKSEEFGHFVIDFYQDDSVGNSRASHFL